jgi:hypothetical protein
LRFLIVK